MNVCAIVLAAGSSVRMGKTNKLLLPVPKTVRHSGTTDLPPGFPAMQGDAGAPRPESLILRVVRTIIRTKASGVLVVTGFEAEKIKRELQEEPVRFVHNPDFETGMTSSIQAAVSNTPKDTAGYMICLADMPFLETEDYNLLLHAFQLNSDKPQRIVVPLVGNTTGNPVIFSAYYKSAILKHKNPNGCKEILKAHERQLLTIELDNERAFRDIDTAASYRNWILNERD